jgi:hypothetical protein
MGENNNTNNNDETNVKNSEKNWIVIAIGIAALIGFGYFIYYLSGIALNPKLDAIVWARQTYLLTGVEAIAFSAAGYFFGKEVNRQRAENAESSAQDAQNEAKKSTSEAVKNETKLRTLSKAVVNAKQGQGERTRGDGDAPRESDSVLSSLADLAKQLMDE